MSPPSRRRVLRRGALVGSLGLSGCLRSSTRDQPTEQQGNPSYDCENGRTVYESDVSVSADAAWPMLQYDAGNTGYNPNATVPDEVSLRWRYTACAEVDGIVTVTNQHVYPGNLVVDAETGARKTGEWRAYQRPAVVDGTLFVGSHDFEAYDAADGDHLWTFEPAGESGGVSAPTVHDGTVYITGNIDDRTVYAIDATDGTEQWQFTPDHELDAPAAAVGDLVSVVDDGGVIYGLDAETGSERWRYESEYGQIYDPPTVTDGTVYTGLEDGGIVAVDGADGRRRWRTEIQTTGDPALAVTEDTVFVVDQEGIFAYARQDGAERWRDESISSEALSVASNAVLVGDGKTLRALAREDGSERWSFQTRSVIFYDYGAGGFAVGPAVVDDVVFVATGASDVYALGPAN